MNVTVSDDVYEGKCVSSPTVGIMLSLVLGVIIGLAVPITVGVVFLGAVIVIISIVR
jgi:hypothetical protein